MGTKMVHSYANLFMGKFEQEALAAAPHSPLSWWRYIDDIFPSGHMAKINLMISSHPQ